MESPKPGQPTSPSSFRMQITVSSPKIQSPSGSYSKLGSHSYENVSPEHMTDSPARPTFFFNRASSAYLEKKISHCMDEELNELKTVFLSHKVVNTLVKGEMNRKELFSSKSNVDSTFTYHKQSEFSPNMNSSPKGLLQVPKNPKEMYQQALSADDVAINKNGIIGQCSKEERLRKLAKYIEKRKKWRAEHMASRKFAGRSKIAETKPRYKGRFVKLSTVKPKEEESFQPSRSDSPEKRDPDENSPKRLNI